MIHRPETLADARATAGEYRAGGTDVQARRRLGVTEGDVVDLAGIGGLDAIVVADDGAVIGAMTRITTVASHRRLTERYPALTATAGSLATPQIRAVGTIGGNLLQRTRCPYYRRGDLPCLKAGGSSCSARAGDHRHGVIYDVGPCVAPHPSSIAMVLLTYDAVVTVDDGGRLTVPELLGDGTTGTRDHELADGAVLTSIELGPPAEAESAAYRRVTDRALAEWPIVEAVARVVVSEGRVTQAAIAAGGIAPVPIRLPAVEDALVGVSVDDGGGVGTATSAAVRGARPLPMTGHKVPLLEACVRDVIERALATEGGDGEIALGEVGLPPRP